MLAFCGLDIFPDQREQMQKESGFCFVEFKWWFVKEGILSDTYTHTHVKLTAKDSTS